MLVKSKNIVLTLIFLVNSIFGFYFGFNGFAQATSSINYKPLKRTGVKILIRDYERKDDNTFEFELYREDVSIKDYIWSVIWRKNFGFYMEGVDLTNKDLNCPYVGEDEKLPGSDIKDIGSGKHHVTLVLPPTLIDAIIENRCAVSPKPRKAPDANKNKVKKSSKSINTLFPTIND